VSYAAEPYAQFVDDLLTSLTGGVAREDFRFLADEQPFRLTPPGPIVANTVRIAGQVDGTYTRFRRDRDFALTPDSAIRWLGKPDGTPAADAVWPDEGTRFYVSYDHTGPAGIAPTLSDRNPGSVTRTLAESFAREYAVLSRQLESVYEAAFLDTSTGRDLDQLVALVGLRRRDRTFAAGTIILSRSSPAAADVFIPAGTRFSTSQPPAVVFETTEDRTLRRGSLSVDAPIRATLGGGTGVVPPRAISVIHRPIFGVETASNPESTALSGAVETDDQLRDRARRAFEASGKGTTGALLAALATLPGTREKDVRIDHNHLLRPGVLTVNVAVPLDQDDCARAVHLIEQTRPAGVRVLHNLDCPTPIGALEPDENPADELETPAQATAAPAGLYLPVVATAVLVPAAASLTPQERQTLKRKGEDAIRTFVEDAGIGETLVYNRLVAALMAIEGVQDVRADLYPQGKYGPGATPPSTLRQNLQPPATLRPTVDPRRDGALHVEIGGQLIALDVTVSVTLTGAGTLGDEAVDLEDAKSQIIAQLREAVGGLGALSTGTLKGAIVPVESFRVDRVTFTVEVVEAGVRVNKVFQEGDPPITIAAEWRVWVRRLSVEKTA
jgi:phage-related baseplate assembly protein